MVKKPGFKESKASNLKRGIDEPVIEEVDED